MGGQVIIYNSGGTNEKGGQVMGRHLMGGTNEGGDK